MRSSDFCSDRKPLRIPTPRAAPRQASVFNETLQKLGIADAMKPKIKLAQVGLTFISKIITEPGVEVVGPLPRDISTPTVLIGYVSAHTQEPDAAQALLRYLSSAEAAAVYKQCGMEPGR